MKPTARSIPETTGQVASFGTWSAPVRSGRYFASEEYRETGLEFAVLAVRFGADVPILTASAKRDVRTMVSGHRALQNKCRRTLGLWAGACDSLCSRCAWALR